VIGPVIGRLAGNSVSEVTDRSQLGDRMVSSRPRTLFFASIALIMVASMFIGFAPTFYLRSLFESSDASGDPGLPTYLVLHGIVLTVWFLLFFVQTVLIVTRRTEVHRRLGFVGALLAVAVVVVATVATVRAIPAGFTAATADVTPVITLITGNLIVLLLFTVFVGTGVYFRRWPATHKRLMLLASVNVIAPAFSDQRAIGRVIQPSVPVPLPILVLIAPLVALLVYDVILYRRPQAATIWGSVAVIAGIVLFEVLVASGVGAALVRWLA
jgi:hypothetical protein